MGLLSLMFVRMLVCGDGVLIVLTFRFMNLSFRCLVLVFFIVCGYVCYLCAWLASVFGFVFRLVWLFEFGFVEFVGCLWFVLVI